jgi:predicted PurR-regulated permease PerM
MSKNLVRIGVAVLTTLPAILVLWQFRTIVAYVLVSLMLAATMRPMFRRLTGYSLIKRLAWIFAYVVLLGGFGYLLFLVFNTSTVEIQAFAKSVTVQDKWVLPIWAGSSIQQVILTSLPSPSVLFQAIIGNEGELIGPALLGVAQGIGGFATAIAIILILAIYWSINQVHFERLWLSILPSDQRKRARSVWRTIEPDIGSYIRGQLIQSLAAGLLLGLGFWLIGSPYPVMLALVGALLCLIPVVGPVLAILAPLLVGLFTSIQIGLFTALFTLIVMLALMIWLKPKLLNRRWNNPILTVIFLIALADTFGLFGIILAPPLSVVCQILWYRLVSHRSVSGAAATISDLKERLNQLTETVSTMEEPRPPLVTSSLSRITALISDAEPVLASQEVGSEEQK